MALLTPLPLSAASALCRKFSIDLGSIEALSEGSVNSNFRLTGSDGRRYFARLYEEQDHAGAAREHALVRTLDDAGVPVVRGLQTLGGESLVDFEGRAFAVFPWVDGYILCQGRVTTDACRNLGAALAAVHLASDRVQELPVGRFRIADLRERLKRVEGAGRASLLPAVARIRGLFDAYEARRSSQLAIGICHGDLFRDNVLWQDGEVRALIDFESVCAGSHAYDLMVTALAWCYGAAFDVGLVSALFEGYAAVRPIPRAEVAALPVEGAIACLRFATTRLTDFSLRVAQGETPVRDYGRFLARLEAIEAGVLNPCFQALGA